MFLNSIGLRLFVAIIWWCCCLAGEQHGDVENGRERLLGAGVGVGERQEGAEGTADRDGADARRRDQSTATCESFFPPFLGTRGLSPRVLEIYDLLKRSDFKNKKVKLPIGSYLFYISLRALGEGGIKPPHLSPSRSLLGLRKAINLCIYVLWIYS